MQYEARAVGPRLRGDDRKEFEDLPMRYFHACENPVLSLSLGCRWPNQPYLKSVTFSGRFHLRQECYSLMCHSRAYGNSPLVLAYGLLKASEAESAR